MVEESDSRPLSSVLAEDPAAADDPHMFKHTQSRPAKIYDGLQHKILTTVKGGEIGASLCDSIAQLVFCC